MKIGYILQLEGAAIFMGALVIYAQSGASWWLFGALILAPDLAMVGYGFGPKIGTFCYNLLHNYVLPAVFVVVGLYFAEILYIHIVIIWIAHIGMDRAIQYGLKYNTGFKDTHINRLN
ncbi:MAG: DUF4260 domain-containing protein [Rhizobiales bacterium]|nr:DUF4260 domain-containing protein [Hyphomicrobiales bacterium]NRB15577.1 DUF4260 domain-containing protein [Hyphomicrobiales bacterium]